MAGVHRAHSDIGGTLVQKLDHKNFLERARLQGGFKNLQNRSRRPHRPTLRAAVITGTVSIDPEPVSHTRVVNSLHFDAEKELCRGGVGRVRRVRRANYVVPRPCWRQR